jgi:4-amino-4-deoxy-L-arabinose transferase-like glycosyltransferase
MGIASSTDERSSGSPADTRVPYRNSSLFHTALAPVAVVLLGLALRLYKLNQESVGFDEAFSMTACRASLAAMMRILIDDFVHPPLHYFVLRGWLDVFGSGVIQARMLSVLFGTLAIAMLYVLTDYLLGRRSALLASLLLAVSQLNIQFAQEARPYAQFLFLFLACCYLFIRALHGRSLKFWCGFVALAVLLTYTHYFGLLVLGTFVVFAFFYRREYTVPAAWWVGGAAVLLLAYLPWLTSGIVPAAMHSGRTFSGRNSFWSVNASTLFGAVNFFNNGKPTGVFDTSPWWTFAIGGLLFSAPAAFALFASKRGPQRQNLTLAAMLWILPILGAIVAGLMHFQYNVRYVAFCAAPYYVLVGHGLSKIRPAALRAILVVLLLGYTANSLRANYFMPRKEGFRAAGNYISQNLQPGDCGVFFPGMNHPVQWTIEHPDLFRILGPEDLTAGLTGCSRIWAVSWSLSGNPWQWEKARVERLPIEAVRSLVSEKRFLWVRVALFARKQP